MLGLTACGLAGGSEGSESGDGEPVTVRNCGDDVEIPSTPERIVLLTGTDVGFLAQLDALGLVVGKAGAYPPDYYDKETNSTVKDIPVLSSRLDDRAALQISDEVILEAEPDLVLDQVRTERFTGLGESGIPVLNDEAMCPDSIANPGFNAVSEQLRTYGTALGREDKADTAVDRLKERVTKARDQVPESEDRTAAVLYPAKGGAPAAYGNRSMAAALIEEAGFTNVYDVLVGLHVDGSPSEVEKLLTTMPGADKLTAVRNDDVMTMLFNFAEPPTPTTVDGLEKIIDRFGDDS